LEGLDPDAVLPEWADARNEATPARVVFGRIATLSAIAEIEEWNGFYLIQFA
jgi:hypothetical protein